MKQKMTDFMKSKKLVLVVVLAIITCMIVACVAGTGGSNKESEGSNSEYSSELLGSSEDDDSTGNGDSAGDVGNSENSGSTGNGGSGENSGNGGSAGTGGNGGDSGNSENSGSAGNGGSGENSGNGGNNGTGGTSGNSGTGGNSGNSGNSGNGGNTGNGGSTGDSSNTGGAGSSNHDKEYGLADNIQDGVILHCFNWKYNDIKKELPNIAAAGFTSVQTSPAQASAGWGAWYWLYQPTGFSVGTNELGTKAELQSLCTEAEKYGIKVIVDVVANHLCGNKSQIPSNLKDSKYWHNFGGVSNWSDRYQVTHGDIGMPDLNSENVYVQNLVKDYVMELKNIGVDGIRWDAAKHISLPSEGCGFWQTVTSQGLYNYGEILIGPDDRTSGNEGLMKEYTNYMTVTDSAYGKTLRDAFASGYAPSAYANWAARGISNNKLIYWGESHDTWSNNQDWGHSNGMSQNVIDRAYAIAASRSDITALYFSRPSSANKESIKAGQKGSTHFTSAEVAQVNHFHNAMIGQKEYFTTGNNCAVVCRETGAVVVAGSGGNFQVTVPNGGSLTKPGTYIDAITGAKWTVTSSTMSGKIGSTGITVLYKEGTYQPSGSTGNTGSTGNGGSSDNTGNTGNTGTIYYKNTNNWSTVYAYYWSSDNTGLTQWPGVPMTSVGNGVYSIEVPKEAEYIIFNIGSNAQQTEDISLEGWDKIYNNGNWSKY